MTLDDFPPFIRAAATKAHAEFADSRCRDNLGVIIARAIAGAIEQRDAETKAALLDPNTVHFGLMRGTIAKPTLTQIAHAYVIKAGDELWNGLVAAERAVWLPIDTAPLACTVDRSSRSLFAKWTNETMWVRDAEGRVFKAWRGGPGCYWWTADGETECTPVEWLPHPLWTPPQAEAEEAGDA